MLRTRTLSSTILLSLLAACSGDEASAPADTAMDTRRKPPTVAGNVIEGTVTSANGPEPGVWVIAETHDSAPASPRSWLPMTRTLRNARTAIGQLRCLVVRGYAWSIRPGSAPHPAAHWISMPSPPLMPPLPRNIIRPDTGSLEIPGADMFPGTGPTGNGISLSVHQAWTIFAWSHRAAQRSLLPARQQGHPYNPCHSSTASIPVPQLNRRIQSARPAAS